MKIRKLTSEDESKLLHLIDVIEENLDEKEFWLPINEVSKEHFFDDRWTEFYGIFDGCKLVASAALFYNEHEYGESLEKLNIKDVNVAEIGRAMVHPEYRGNNLLYSINQKLVDVARTKNIKFLLATIHPKNIPSQKSFTKLGMKKETTYKKSCGFIRDVFMMEIK